MKKGDRVLVYGTIVNWRAEKRLDGRAEHWFLRGRPAKILDVVNSDELTVKFLKDEKAMRPVTGIVTEVHPKQYRKVKK